MNPEKFHNIDREEDPGDAFAGFKQERNKYSQALEKSIKNVRAEDEQEIANNEGIAALTSLGEQKKYLHEGHPKFDIFYRSMNPKEKESYRLLTDRTEKERIFKEWLDNRKK